MMTTVAFIMAMQRDDDYCSLHVHNATAKIAVTLTQELSFFFHFLFSPGKLLYQLVPLLNPVIQQLIRLLEWAWEMCPTTGIFLTTIL